VKAPTYTKYGDSKEPGRLVERHNLYVVSGQAETAGNVKEVPYQYRLDKAEQVAAKVRQWSGIGKVTQLLPE
jgi:pectate lyase